MEKVIHELRHWIGKNYLSRGVELELKFPTRADMFNAELVLRRDFKDYQMTQTQQFVPSSMLSFTLHGVKVNLVTSEPDYAR